MKKLLLLLTLIFISESVLAQYYGRRRSKDGEAKVYFEAYTGYYKGSIEGTNITGLGLNGDAKSLIAGTRMGYQFAGGLITGIDFSFGKSGSVESTNSIVNEYDYEPLDIGAFVGYQLNSYIRVWGSYIFSHTVNLDGVDSGGNPLDDFKGEGYNAGISIKGLPFLRVNLEYHIRDINEIGGAAVTVNDNKSETFLLSLSVPFDLPLDRLIGR